MSGTRSVRDTVRLFTKSDEFYNTIVTQGVQVTVRTLYQRLLAREPENQIVVDGWADMASRDWKQAVDGFVDSPEYVTRFGDDKVPHA